MRSYWDEDLAILSAENVSFSVETAGLGSRFAALVIDFTLQMLVLLLLTLAAAGFNSYVYAIEELPPWLVNIGLGLAGVLAFLLFYGYFFLFEWLWDGQTPGKRYLGLRVMMADGMPITLWPALTRNVVRVMDSQPLFTYGFGGTVTVLNPLNQRAGDLVAGTVVARERRREQERKPLTINEAVELFLTAATTVPGLQQTPEPLQDEALSMEIQSKIDPEAAALALKLNREDYELVRDFLRRREALPREARDRLGRSLLVRFAAKLNRPVPTDGERWLEEITVTLARAYGR